MLDERLDDLLERHVAVALRDLEREAQLHGLVLGLALGTQRLGYHVQQVGQLGERHVVGRIRVELLPRLGEDFQIGIAHQVGRGEVEVGEVLEDDGDDEVEEDERADDLERDEVGDGGGRAAVALGERALAARLVLHRVRHHGRPAVARQALEEQQEGVVERVEVAVAVDARGGVGDGVAVRDEGEHVDAEDGIDEDDERQQRADVEQRREGEHHRHDEVAQLLGPLEQAQDAQNAQDAHHAEQHRRDGQKLGEELGGKLVEQRGADEEEVELAPRVGEVAAAAERGDLYDELDVVDHAEDIHRPLVRA